VVDWGFLRSGASYRRWALKQHGLRPGDLLLDVACGTGLVAVEAARIIGAAERITCLDPSAGMLAVARTKLAAKFVQARAEAMPLKDDSFDFLTKGRAWWRLPRFPAHVTVVAGPVIAAGDLTDTVASAAAIEAWFRSDPTTACQDGSPAVSLANRPPPTP